MSTPTAPAPDEEVVDAPHEPSQPTWRRLLTGSTTSIFLVLVALIAIFSLLQFNEFFTVSNLRNIATDAAVLLVVATGLTYVIITAGHRPVGRIRARVRQRRLGAGDERRRRRQLGHHHRRRRSSACWPASPGGFSTASW